MTKLKFFTPARIVTVSFGSMILIGALLLNLPIASRSCESVGFLNALFTATSANCVTGLAVVNTAEHWSWFGKGVILVLIQLGALGFITVYTLAMIIMRKQVSLQSRLVIQASFNQENVGGMVRLVKNIVFITLAIEGIGAALLALGFLITDSLNPGDALIRGIFHSVSAFCNAGFDIIGSSSLTPYLTNTYINVVVMGLIIAGGLGFPVWIELISRVKTRDKRSFRIRVKHLSLHSKIVFTVTGILIIIGTLFYLPIEWSNPQTLGALSAPQKFMAALFQSVTMRTAGFCTIDQAGFNDISKFFSCFLMLVGGSSASTAGGMKTVTIGIIVAAMLSALKGKNRIEAFGRTLPLDLLQKALTVLCTMIFVVFISTTILYFTELDNSFSHSFIDLLFESCSAAGTVGVTAGITPFLSVPGKMVIILCMFMGRLSPVTVVVALSMKYHRTLGNVKFPEERVIVG